MKIHAGLLLGVAAALAVACQSYNMEQVDEKVVIAVETAGTFASARAPVLLIVQDRSGSMNYCFGAAVPGSHSCTKVDGSSVETDGRLSRMAVARQVMSGVVEENADGVRFGLVSYGVSNRCTAGEVRGEVLVPPGTDAAQSVVDAYANKDVLVNPSGATPTAAALATAYDTLVDESGHRRDPDRKNFVLLVTDGLMNCNPDFPVGDQACICPNEAGCNGTAYGQSIAGAGDSQRTTCLDLDATKAQVDRLRDAGVTTFVVGLGESFSGGAGDLAVRVLNDLAIAGGAPRQGDVKFFPAGDPAALEASLSEIVGSITAPCTYDLDGAVCDGRLVAISLQVTDAEGTAPREIQTRCDPGLGPNTWFFEKGNPRRLTFDPALCSQLEDASKVTISIRGVENDCKENVTPSCGAPAGP